MNCPLFSQAEQESLRTVVDGTKSAAKADKNRCLLESGKCATDVRATINAFAEIIGTVSISLSLWQAKQKKKCQHLIPLAQSDSFTLHQKQ